MKHEIRNKLKHKCILKKFSFFAGCFQEEEENKNNTKLKIDFKFEIITS